MKSILERAFNNDILFALLLLLFLFFFSSPAAATEMVGVVRKEVDVSIQSFHSIM